MLFVESDKKDQSLSYRQLDAENVADFKLLNQAIFPVRYTEQFYRDCRAAGELNELAFLGRELVGAIGCRLETSPAGLNKVYIATLGVYSAHRGQGIGSELLARLLDRARKDQNNVEAYLHVQTSNMDAIRFYIARGFCKGETVQNYYRRINPPHAVVLRKLLTV